MCKFKSGVILKNKVVLAPLGNESHSDLLESLNIEDNYFNATKKFVRVELLPPNGQISEDISKWKYYVDQGIVPDWYEEDEEKYENEFRTKVKEFLEENFVCICGYLWSSFKCDQGTCYVMFDNMKKSCFGINNNWAESTVRKELLESELLKDLKQMFGEKLVPLTIDLNLRYGLNDYGIIEGDLIAIPTYDFYLHYIKDIPSFGNWYWLATPYSTHHSYGSDYVCCVDGDGGVGYSWCRYGGAVRPFFILKSSNESEEEEDFQERENKEV